MQATSWRRRPPPHGLSGCACRAGSQRPPRPRSPGPDPTLPAARLRLVL